MALSGDAVAPPAADTGVVPDHALQRMLVIHHSHLAESLHDGKQRFAVVDAARGIGLFEVWMHTLAPGAHSPVQQHRGEMAVLALAGGGKLLVAGGPQRFQSPCTLVIPPATEFQFVNNASVPLQLVEVFTDAPTRVQADPAPGG